jgi:aspartyl-tRNA(Asn)/glutamyl-tRNA(Gln) amidotransferase subunit A
MGMIFAASPVIVLGMTMLISHIADALASGQLSARDHLEGCLAAIDSEDGRRAFVTVHAEGARRNADQTDALRKAGATLPAFAGVTLSVKDLFDIAGEVTRAGSRVLDDAAPASTDATVVARLKAAGFNIIGRTNMTEFAYSGLGMNPHYGNPRSPYGRDIDEGFVAGGSSSGSAVSISDGMAAATIGSDTGGSTRAPAVFCGITGMKPTTTRMPGDGVFPLSTSFDAAGPMGHSVDCCAILDSIMTGGSGAAEPAFPASGLRLAVPRGYLFADLDDQVAEDFEAALSRLSATGVTVSDVRLDILEELRPANLPKSIVSAEAYEIHRELLASGRDLYDPYIATRLAAGSEIAAADYITMHRDRAAVCAEVAALTRPFDALILPTTPTLPPALAGLQGTDLLMKTSARILRNTALSNYLDRPTITIPGHAPGTAPTGVSLIGSHRHDRRLLAIAAGLEDIIRVKA